MPNHDNGSVWDAPEEQGSGGHYLKVKDGQSVTLRILGPVVNGEAMPLHGYEYWEGEGKERRPVRVATKAEVPKSALERKNQWGKSEVRMFWSFIVYNHTANAIQIWTITQGTVRDQLKALRKTRSWVNPLTYDIVFSRVKTDSGVEYTVVNEEKTPIDPAIVKEGKAVNIGAIMTGDDPFDKSARFDPKELESDDDALGIDTVIGPSKRNALKALHLPENEEKAILKRYDFDSTTSVTEGVYDDVLADFTAAAERLAAKAKPAAKGRK